MTSSPTSAPRRALSRPLSARAVARGTKSFEGFGLNVRDWFHEIRRFSTRAQLLAAVRTRPERLAGRFAGGEVADAFLAAQVEWLCNRAGVPPPRWTRDRRYVLDRPWFALPSPRLRTHLLLDTPDEFRNRNLFTTPEAHLNIRRGRPAMSLEHQREMTRLRQQRFRARRRRLHQPS